MAMISVIVPCMYKRRMRTLHLAFGDGEGTCPSYGAQVESDLLNGKIKLVKLSIILVRSNHSM